MRAPCPCGQKKTYMQCCRRLLSGKDFAKTAEALMRSRYTAFVKHDSSYLKKTASGPATVANQASIAFDPELEWVRLEIQRVIRGQATDSIGEVTFTAIYRHQSQPNKLLKQHEHSLFKKHDGQWFYVGSDIENSLSHE